MYLKTDIHIFIWIRNPCLQMFRGRDPGSFGQLLVGFGFPNVIGNCGESSSSVFAFHHVGSKSSVGLCHIPADFCRALEHSLQMVKEGRTCFFIY